MIYKRGKIYWYKFVFNGALVRESTKQGNDKVARQMESAHRTSLAKGEVGIREKKVAPTLKEFMEKQFEPWVKATFAERPRTRIWYIGGVRRLSDYAPIIRARLSEISPEMVRAYIAKRQSDGLNVTSVNRELQILRRILHLAVEWGATESTAKIRMLPGEKRRERVVTSQEEVRYLAVAPEPLLSVATVLFDTGMRPDECYRLRWENITWDAYRYGALLVTHGKTNAARRILPMTNRVRDVLQAKWEAAAKPDEGYVWPASTRSGHIEVSSIRHQHDAAFKTITENAKESEEKPVRPFMLYSLRHTFLTRLGQSGVDVWTVSRIAGHSSIGISARYVHPSEDAVLDAISRLSGHKNGHNEKSPAQLPVAKFEVSAAP
jgi:integrase